MGIKCAISTFHVVIPGFVKKTSFFLILLFACPAFSQQASVEDVKKEAGRLFEEEEFTKAYKLYAQLVSNFPKDAEYNYRLGVCMIYSEPDKKKCIPYLKAAAANNDAPRDALFYLGKAYHINYRFDEAIKNYTEFKQTASAARQKKLQVDREITACNNGKHLLSNLTDLVVLNKKQLNEADYFRSYDLKNIGGKLLVKPEEFKTASDKKKKEKSVVFLPKGSNVVYYSSYGESTENGKDLYTVARLPNGTYGKPEKVKGINTAFDEDYPFLHPDGKTLYFASKGYNSMGGYDIFKTVYNEETNTWSAPVNLEFPINSPDDDFLFVTDSLEKTAYFSTGRQSPPGKIDVLKINTERKPIDVLVIKGTVLKGDEAQSQSSIITVKKAGTDETVGTFSATPNGDYSLALPNGANLDFTIETPGLKTQSDLVSLPFATTSKPYKQSITYENGELRIRNDFDGAASDDNYLQYLDVIEKKAKLDVNAGENKLQTPANEALPLSAGETGKNKDTAVANVSAPKHEINNSRPEVVVEESASPAPPAPAAPKQSMDNRQLASIARQDALEAVQEAGQLDRDAKDAAEVGRAQKAEAEKKLAEADAAITAANNILNEEGRKKALEKAQTLKTSAENDKVVAEKIIALAKSLNDDADTKRKEARLNSDYATELEKTASAKNDNGQSLAKLEDLQKQITETSGQKNTSAEAMEALKNDIDEKEKELASTEKMVEGIKTNLEEIKTVIGGKETELAQTRRKSAKQEITTQINDLKAEQAEKEKQIVEKEDEIKKINEELAGLKNEQELATRIQSEDIAATTEDTKKVNAVATVQNATNKSLQEKYKDKIAISDPKSAGSVQESNDQLKSFNAEIDQAIAKNKANLPKIKTATAKQQINSELKQLQSTRQKNQQQIAANNQLLASLSKPAADASRTGMYPVTASTPAEAIKGLDQLEAQLGVSENDNFDFNGYQNPQAQSLKVEADSKINDAIAQQKKLKDIIEASKTQVEANRAAAPTATASAPQLNKDAEDLQNKALDLRNTAKTKEGAEKDQLVNEAKKLEEESTEKSLQAAAVNKEDNARTFAANSENIEALIRRNTSAPADVSTAKQLNEEAMAAYRQAKDIRKEAESLTNKGAMLGSMSNAEEKEAEAVLKQQQAVELLKKANPDYVLKTATPVGNPAATLSEQLETVNKNLADLVNTKLESYQKLYDANNLELDQLTNNIENKQAALDNTPSLKSDAIAAGTKTEAAKNLKTKADESATPAEKLNNLVAAIKKQNEAVKQSAALNASLEKISAAPTTTSSSGSAEEPVAQETATASPAVEEPAKQEPVQEPVAKETPPTATSPIVEEPAKQEPTATQEPVAKETTPATTSPAVEAAVNTNTETSAPETVQTRGDNSSAAPGTSSKELLSELSNRDTTSAQILTYFNTTTPDLNNRRAGNQAQNALAQLKNAEAEARAVDAEIENITRSATSADPAELKRQSDVLLTEAEQLSTKAQETRTEADSKTGDEKNSLLAKAKDLDKEAQDKTLKAAALTNRANETDYETNSSAIAELLARLKADNASLYAALSQKNSDLLTQHNQAVTLLSEANAQENTAVRIGAISNAEEREIALLQQQNQLVNDLKKQYPDYVMKKAEAPASSAEIPETLINRKKEAAEKQYAELANLTNAFSLEYESTKNAAPRNARQKADTLNSESKRLLIRSAQEKNEKEKIKLLTLAAKSGNAAVEELKKLVPQTNLATNRRERNAAPAPAAENNTTARRNSTPERTTAPPATAHAAAGRNTVKIEGLEIIAGNAYNANRPIPLNAKMEDGLVFRVQIGAFKVQLPNDAFRGLSPLNAETTANGYYRYTAGNFNKFEVANAVKNDLHKLGYSDAFVVGYYNGKRISISEALALLSQEGKPVDIVNAPQSAGITANANVPPSVPAVQPNIVSVPVAKELEQSNGLLYTIQIGVYGRASQQSLLNLKPIYTEKLPGGLFRFTAGIYNSTEKAIADKRKVVDLGIKDAFVSAYLNGKRITFADAKNKQESDASIKMEPENPVVFPDATTVNAAPAETPVTAPAPQPATAPATVPSTVQPYKNGVTAYPAATAENGIKANEEGVTFKVQIGAYSKQVPGDVAEKFSAIKSWPVENKQINNLFIYNIGNFSEARFAKILKEEAIRVGLSDAFISVYKDGKKLYGAEAAQYLAR